MTGNLEQHAVSVPIIVPQQIVQRTIPPMELRVDEAIAGKPAVIDMILSNVLLIDSAGLNWLLSVQSRLETMGIHMRLLDPSPIMADVLLVTRLDSRFAIAATGMPEDQKPGNGGVHAG